jgi:hypothetical protein
MSLHAMGSIDFAELIAEEGAKLSPCRRGIRAAPPAGLNAGRLAFRYL